MTALPQHMQALASANEQRIAVAVFKREVKALNTRAATERVAASIEDWHDNSVLGAAKIRQLLMCVPRLGQGKMTRLLLAAGVKNFDKRLRDLTPRQRTAIAFELRHWSRNYRGDPEFVPGALRVAGPVVESRPESTRGELQVGGYDARLPTPTPFGDVS